MAQHRQGGSIKYPVPPSVELAFIRSYADDLPEEFWDEEAEQYWLSRPTHRLINTYNEFVRKPQNSVNRHYVRVTKAILEHRQWYLTDNGEWDFSLPQGGASAAQRGVAAQIREQYVLTSKQSRLANMFVHSNNNYPFGNTTFDSVEYAVRSLGLTDQKRNWVGGSNCFKRSRAMA